MLKLRHLGVALVLALLLCVTMLGSGAFTQSAEHNAHAATVVATHVQHVAQLAATQQVNLQNVNHANPLVGPHWPSNGIRHWKCGWQGWGWHRFWRCGWQS